MKTISASEFKAKCLHLMDEVQATGESITVTKHGKPVATISPATVTADWLPGKCAGSVQIVGDLVEPVFDPKDLDLDRKWF